MKNYYQGTEDHPYHISVGAVVVNEEGKILCHHFHEIKRHKQFERFKDIYILMRETMEMGETIESALHRGLKEEFNVIGEIVTYIGSLNQIFRTSEGVEIEKTTLYFLVRMKEMGERDRGDAEGESELEWHDAVFLASKMKEQSQKFSEETIDESEVVKRVKDLIKK